MIYPKTLENLFGFRHGAYDLATSKLTRTGKEQMQKQAEILSGLMNGDKPHILCSIAPHAVESALIFGEAFGVQVTAEEILWSGPDKPKSIVTTQRRVVEMLCKLDAKVAVIVAHMDYISGLPHAMGRPMLRSHSIPRQTVLLGGGWQIDASKRKVTTFKPPVVST